MSISLVGREGQGPWLPLPAASAARDPFASGMEAGWPGPPADPEYDRPARQRAGTRVLTSDVVTPYVAVQAPRLRLAFNAKGTPMDEQHDHAREQFFAAMRSLAASADPIQSRLIEANTHILLVTIDEFEGDHELRIKFAKLLDLLAVDQDDMEAAALETAAHMTDFEAVKVADLICDFYGELG